MHLSFEKYKLSRFIESHGGRYHFFSCETNIFKEPVGGKLKEVTISGVYHETQGYVTSKADAGSNIKTKPDAQIMCRMEDAQELEAGMVVVIQGKNYRLVDLRNVNNLGVACDLSLELILDGRV